MLEDYLLPNEKINWTGPQIELGKERFSVYITNKRFILYRRKGAIIKKEDLIAEKIKDIQNINYRQEGLLGKKATLTITLKDRKIQLSGIKENVKSVYQNLMQFWESE